MKETTVELRCSYPTSNRREGFFCTLDVRDRSSGQQILSLDLDAEQFGALLASRSLTDVAAEVIEPKQAGRVGLERQHKELRPPVGLVVGYSKTPTDEMSAWGEKQLSEHGFEVGSWTRHNFGWAFHMSAWTPEASS